MIEAEIMDSTDREILERCENAHFPICVFHRALIHLPQSGWIFKFALEFTLKLRFRCGERVIESS